VERDSLALERAQMVVKPGWAARFRAVHKKRKSATG
jgi:hypothetical protein